MADGRQEASEGRKRPLIKAKMKNGNTLVVLIEWPNANPYSLDDNVDQIQAREDVVPYSAWV